MARLITQSNSKRIDQASRQLSADTVCFVTADGERETADAMSRPGWTVTEARELRREMGHCWPGQVIAAI